MDWEDEECASCGSIIVNQKRQTILEPVLGGRHEEPMPICTICESSNALGVFTHPHAFAGVGVQIQTIAQIGNLILDAIEEIKK